MDLKGFNVLIDGYNLELEKGTGVKTYGFGLIKALKILGANVDILLGTVERDSIFRNNGISQKVVRRLDILFRIAAFRVGAQLKAKRIAADEGFLSNNAHLGDLTRFAGLFYASNCYHFANVRYKQVGRRTLCAVPQKIDIWHSTYPIPIKVKGVKKITTILDLIPVLFPEMTLDDEKSYFENIRDSIEESEVLITISENSKRDIVRFFDVDPDKISVTYLPIMTNDLMVDEDNMSQYLKKNELNIRNYILFVGAIEPRKNIGRLIDAYSSLDTDMPLVIAGKKGWLWKGDMKKIESFEGKNLRKKIKYLDYVSTEHLGFLYSGACCFVFPSIYEGFGLPPPGSNVFWMSGDNIKHILFAGDMWRCRHLCGSI